MLIPWDFECHQLNQYNGLKLDRWQAENALLVYATLSCLVSTGENAVLCQNCALSHQKIKMRVNLLPSCERVCVNCSVVGCWVGFLWWVVFF